MFAKYSDNFFFSTRLRRVFRRFPTRREGLTRNECLYILQSSIVLSLLLAPCATEAFAQGQRNRAAILGVVTDASDATVASANVKVTNEEAGSEYNTVCDGLGNFIVPSLLPGRYTRTVSHEGFTVFIAVPKFH
jgi:hypothetical protein